jgi:hypothetical protein
MDGTEQELFYFLFKYLITFVDLFTFLNYEKLTLDKTQCTSVCRYSLLELSEVQKQDGLGGANLQIFSLRYRP